MPQFSKGLRHWVVFRLLFMRRKHVRQQQVFLAPLHTPEQPELFATSLEDLILIGPLFMTSLEC